MVNHKITMNYIETEIDGDYVLINYEVPIEDSMVILNKITDNVDKSELYNTNREYTMLFPIKEYLEQIWKTYNYDSNKIWKQFCVDFPRMEFLLNNEKITDYMVFFNKISPYWFKKNIVFENIRTYLLIVMLCNQSTFGLPYETLYYKYSDIDNNIHVTSGHSLRRLKFKTNGDHEIECAINTSYNIYDVDHLVVLYRIDVNILFDIQITENHNTKPIGILSWKLVKMPKEEK
jgi:hypothetical protein